MGTSNRVRLTSVRESLLGTTPGTPRMRTVRITQESLSFTPDYIDSEELRADRMLGDPIKVMQASAGAINFEFSYPVDNSPLSDMFRSGYYSTWTNTPQFDNDGVADSVITDAGTTSNTYTVASGGAAVKAGHLVRATGFANSANNQIFRATSSTGTTIVGTGLSLSAETAPAATARLKVVGFQGASGDITATSNGLGSTSLDFTTLGLAVGRWLKIGGTAAGDKFATAACNDWVRIIAISANAITLDNLPSGWATDAGTGKTLKVWFGDQIKNGVTQTSLSIEKGFMDQQTPTYIVNRGMVVDQLQMTLQSRQKITGQATFTGMSGAESTTSLSDTPDAATTNQVMAGNANVGRLAENGATLVAPNWARSLEFTINNNLRALEAIDAASPVGINPGECTVTGKISTYFGDDTLLAKMYAGTPTSISSRISKNGQATVFQFPRVTFRSGNPQAAGKNQDVMIDMDFTASVDTLTNSSAICDRLEYFE